MMKVLSKIILIKSANVPYAEVDIDSNVHFSGTQGVGKSTILRAILFFYNADQQHLGIEKEKDSFFKYYLPGDNSYIVYQVQKEHNKFCIVLLKGSLGQGVFYFIDSAYDKKWFIKDNYALTFDKVKKNIDKSISISNQVKTMSEYRDIIFGNTTNNLKDFRQYSLIESKNYQNIPRTIQNVLLNTKLEAAFIKQTIVNSLQDNIPSLNLDYYRNQLSQFENNYNDMKIFLKEETISNAKNIIDALKEIRNIEGELSLLKKQIKYQHRKYKENIPIIASKLTEVEKKISELSALIGKLNTDYNQKHDNFTEQIGVVANKIEETKDEYQKYIKECIFDKISLVDTEIQVRNDLKSKQEIWQQLTNQFTDIETKYNQLITEVVNNCNAQKLEFDKQKSKAKEDFMSKKYELENQHNETKDTLSAEYQDNNKKLLEQKVMFSQEISKIDAQITIISNTEPNKDIIEQKKEQKKSIDDQLKDAQSNHDSLKKDNNAYREKSQLEIEKKTIEHDSKVKEKQSQISEKEKQIQDLDNLLSKQEGSFIDFLNQEKTDWKQTIGKIAKEDTILYNNTLSPRIVSNDNSFFGIELNLENVECHARSLEDINQEKELINSQIDEIRKQISEIVNQKQNEISKISEKYTNLIKENDKKISEYFVLINTLPNKQKAIELELEKLINNQAKEQQRLIDIENQNKQQKEDLLSEIEQKISDLDNDFKQRKEDLKESLKMAIAAQKEIQDSAIANFDKQIEEADLKCNVEIERFQNQKNQELEGKGADTNAINAIEKEINELEKIAEQIDCSKVIVAQFKQFKTEKYDKLDEVEAKLKELKNQDQALKAEYENQYQTANLDLKQHKNQKSSLENQKNEIDKALEAFETFIANHTYCPNRDLGNEEFSTMEALADLISKFSNSFNGRIGKFDEFKKSIHNFVGKFSPENVFHFPKFFPNDNDYFAFADNLKEFVEHKKIDQYQTEMSDKYFNIYKDIYNDYSSLKNLESDVNKTINNINKDFNERNFAGVIKLIELKSEKSEDRLVKVFEEINQFYLDNQYQMGGMNLFSDTTQITINKNAIKLLQKFIEILGHDSNRKYLSVSDIFRLMFRIIENDRDTGFVEKIANVGSDGTDILVKAMINIMLLNVFKKKASKTSGEFRLHCMMDEIGKLHSSNIKGILQFANDRDIILINCSPENLNSYNYKYNYLLYKDEKSKTHVEKILSNNSIE